MHASVEVQFQFPNFRSLLSYVSIGIAIGVGVALGQCFYLRQRWRRHIARGSNRRDSQRRCEVDGHGRPILNHICCHQPYPMVDEVVVGWRAR